MDSFAAFFHFKPSVVGGAGTRGRMTVEIELLEYGTVLFYFGDFGRPHPVRVNGPVFDGNGAADHRHIGSIAFDYNGP